ncbi:hypothetical protein ACYZTX_08145 [Pseudomonas sp. MDT1-17]
MTTIQIYALIGLIVTAGLLFWFGHMVGRSDGLTAGIEEGKDIQRAENARTILELKASLQFIQADHKHLAQQCKKLKDSKVIVEEHHRILLDIAEKLRIAAETFSAFRTGKKLERDTLELRDQALAMATLLEPVAKENAA